MLSRNVCVRGGGEGVWMCVWACICVCVCRLMCLWYLMGWWEAQEGFWWSQCGLLCRRPEADAQGGELIRVRSYHTIQQQWPEQAQRKCVHQDNVWNNSYTVCKIHDLSLLELSIQPINHKLVVIFRQHSLNLLNHVYLSRIWHLNRRTCLKTWQTHMMLIVRDCSVVWFQINSWPAEENYLTCHSHCIYIYIYIYILAKCFPKATYCVTFVREGSHMCCMYKSHTVSLIKTHKSGWIACFLSFSRFFCK